MVRARHQTSALDAQYLRKLGSQSAFTSEGGAGGPPQPNMEAENGSKKE